jgi:hypothetical protein
VLWALLGMIGCAAPPPKPNLPDDAAVDLIWACLMRGDGIGAAQAAARIGDPDFAERARLDVLAWEAGRPAALVDVLDRGHWLAARFLASGESASATLAEARRGGADGACVWIEEARRATRHGRQLSAARAAQRHAPGAPEALALEIELLLADGELTRARRLWAGRPVDSARWRLLGRELDGRVGRIGPMVEGVLDDLHSGLAVPASLSLLEVALRRGASAEQESRMRVVLEQAPIVGPAMLRARDRLLAILAARDGRMADAAAALARCGPLLPEEEAARRRWSLRASGGAPATLEERVDLDPERAAGADLVTRRLASEWDLAARESYRDAGRGQDVSLPDFLARLDATAAPLGDVPTLAGLPRRRFGVFGTLLDTSSLRARLPEAVVLAGKALTLPAELAWFDRVDCRERDLPGPWGRYEECLVRRPRVLGSLAASGVAIAGAGLDRLVYLDLDEIERERLGIEAWMRQAPQQARPARDRQARLSTDEPLDVVARLQRRARQDAGDGYDALLLETIALHEQQHILDFQAFVARGAVGQLVTLAGAGLLPGSVRAAIERRAQLHALREASDPRVALAQAVAQLPVEGARRADAHAVGYARLVEQFLQRLDGGPLPDGSEPGTHGIDRGRVLLQQLDRLPPETVRALARALDD